MNNQWEMALHDFQEALQNIPEDVWTLVRRGNTYRMRKCYPEALLSLNQALLLDAKNGQALAIRGETYRLMRRYEEALADFDRALVLNEKSKETIALRGETYRLIGRYEEALADFDHAIALDEQNDWSQYGRALLQFILGRQEAFRRDINAALATAQSKSEHSPKQSEDFYRLRFHIALYLLANGSTEAAQAEYAQLLSMCQMRGRLQSAVDDVKDLLTLQPANRHAQQMLRQLEACIQKLMLARNL